MSTNKKHRTDRELAEDALRLISHSAGPGQYAFLAIDRKWHNAYLDVHANCKQTNHKAVFASVSRVKYAHTCRLTFRISGVQVAAGLHGDIQTLQAARE
jgi:hypothetical protein